MNRSAFVQIMACRLFGAMPFSKPIDAGLFSIVSSGTTFGEIFIKIQNFSLTKMHMKISYAKWRSFFQGRWVNWIDFVSKSVALQWYIPYFVTLRSVLYFMGLFNSSPPGQNGRHIADDNFRCIFMDGNFCILIIGGKPLSEPMLTWFTDAYMRH